jgi:DNA invertase Pin-like site-specific DNA recombinase
MVYAYLRVSTGKQDGRNQRIGVEALATARGLHIDEYIDEYIDEEGVSGTVDPEKRELGKLLSKLQSGDILIAGEISRLGRSLFMIFRILEYCMNNGITIMTAKDGYTLGNDIQSKVMAFAFGLSAEIERDMISRRTKEALELRKAQGVHLGRKLGSKNSYTKITGKENWIKEQLNKGVPKAKIARALKIDRSTLWRYIKQERI